MITFGQVLKAEDGHRYMVLSAEPSSLGGLAQPYAWCLVRIPPGMDVRDFGRKFWPAQMPDDPTASTIVHPEFGGQTVESVTAEKLN